MPIAGRATTPNAVRNNEAGLLLIGAGAILLFVSLFLEWYQRGTDAWEAFEVWDLVLATLALGALVAVAGHFGFGAPRPASWLIGPAIAALAIVLFVLINPPPTVARIDDDPSTGLWLALAGAVLMAAGALLSVARISVAFTRADSVTPRPGSGDPAARGGGRFTRGATEPVEPVAPAGPTVPPTEPTRRL